MVISFHLGILGR